MRNFNILNRECLKSKVWPRFLLGSQQIMQISKTTDTHVKSLGIGADWKTTLGEPAVQGNQDDFFKRRFMIRNASLRIATRVLCWAKRAITNWRTFGISTLLKKGTKEPPLDIVKLTNKFFTAAWGKITMRAWYFIPHTVKNPIIANAVRGAPAVLWEFCITPASFWTKTLKVEEGDLKALLFHLHALPHPCLLVSVWNGVSCHNGTQCPPRPGRRLSRPASLPWTPVCEQQPHEKCTSSSLTKIHTLGCTGQTYLVLLEEYFGFCGGFLRAGENEGERKTEDERKWKELKHLYFSRLLLNHQGEKGTTGQASVMKLGYKFWP